MPEPAARRDLTVRDAILAAVEQNSGLPVWREVAAAGELPVEFGSGEGSCRPPASPPVERSDAEPTDRDVRSEVRRHA